MRPGWVEERNQQFRHLNSGLLLYRRSRGAWVLRAPDDGHSRIPGLWIAIARLIGEDEDAIFEEVEQIIRQRAMGKL